MKRKARAGQIPSILVMSLLSLLILLPLLYIIAISFTSDAEIVENGYRLLPEHINFDAYKQIFSTGQTIVRAYGVTIFVTVVGTAMSLFLTTTIAYVVSRRDFPYRRFYSLFLLMPLLFNGGMVASYIINSQLLSQRQDLGADPALRRQRLVRLYDEGLPLQPAL